MTNNTQPKRLRKRWKFLILTLLLTITSIIGVTYFLVANDAPIISGNVYHDIEYKPGLKLDLYEPTQNLFAKVPVVVYIHGGAWIGGIKEGLNFNRFNQAVNNLRESGYAIVSINYTLAESDKSPFPTCIEDATDAVRWVQKNAADKNFDLNNVGLFGESAGAHIAMMVGYSKLTEFADATPAFRFNYLVDVYGPNKLKGIYEAPAIDTLYYANLAKLPASLQEHLDLTRYIFGFDPKKDSARAAQIMETYSPYNYVAASSPPTLMIHGDKDRVVPVDQSMALKARLDSLQIENELHIVEGADHAFAYATPEQKSMLQDWIVEFVKRHYVEAK